MQRLIALLILGFGISLSTISAQLEVVFDSDNAVPCGGTTSIDVRVNNFTDIIAAQWSINWDPNILSYNSIENVTTVLPQFTQAGNIGTPDQGGIINPGQATVSWSLSSTLPESLPDGTRLFSIVFNGDGNNGDITNLTVTSTPLNIEVIIDDGNFTDIGAVGSGGTMQMNCQGGMECGPNNGNPSCMSGDAGGIILYGSDELVKPGENGCIAITTDNWTDIQSAQFNLNWDPALLFFTGSQNLCPSLSSAQTNANNNTGVMTFLWFDGTGSNPTTKANGDVIVEICFDAVGANNTYADISFSNVEIADSGQNIIPTLADCGSIEICCPPPPGLEFTLVANDITVNQGDEGCIDISALDFVDIASMQFTIAWDETIAQYNNPNIQNINPALIPNPLFNFFSPDNVRMTWNSSNGLGLDIADGETLFQICFDGIGDPGTMTPILFIDVPGVDIEIGNGNGEAIDPVILDEGSLTIADATPCMVSAQVVFPLCAGETGGITLNITDGMEPYSCMWTFDNGNGNPVPLSVTDCEISSGLPGLYCVTVTDANGMTCEVCATIEDPDPLTYDDTQKNIDCDGLGEVCISNIAGGSGTKTVTWSDGPSGLKRTGLTAGNYTATITDENDCFVSETFTIVNTLTALALSGTPEGAGCSGLGKVNLTPTGGCPVYSYMASAGTPSGDMIIDIPAGDVSVTVTDMNGSTDVASFTIADGVEDLMASVATTAETCDGDENGTATITITGGCTDYSSSMGTVSGNQLILPDLAPGDYTVTITDAQGSTIDVDFTIDPGTMIDITATATPSSGMDGTIELIIDGGSIPYTVDGDLENLAPGDYTITVTDANGCAGQVMVTVPADEIMISSLTVTSEALFGTGVSCPGQEDGELTWTTVPATGVSATLNGNPATSPATGLAAGNYILQVTDMFGNTSSQTVTITSPESISVSFESTCSDANATDGAIDLMVSGGNAPYSYAWSTGAFTEDIENLAIGNYTVMIMDANDCEAPLLMDLDVEDCDTEPMLCYVSYNNIITPGTLDGMNDVLEIKCAMDRSNTIQIYDRWGQDVFVQANYDNSWGGVSTSGVVLGEGTYFWVMDVDFGTERKLFKGFVTILRDTE